MNCHMVPDLQVWFLFRVVYCNVNLKNTRINTNTIFLGFLKYVSSVTHCESASYWQHKCRSYVCRAVFGTFPNTFTSYLTLSWLQCFLFPNFLKLWILGHIIIYFHNRCPLSELPTGNTLLHFYLLLKQSITWLYGSTTTNCLAPPNTTTPPPRVPNRPDTKSRYHTGMNVNVQRTTSVFYFFPFSKNRRVQSHLEYLPIRRNSYR